MAYKQSGKRTCARCGGTRFYDEPEGRVCADCSDGSNALDCLPTGDFCVWPWLLRVIERTAEKAARAAPRHGTVKPFRVGDRVVYRSGRSLYDAKIIEVGDDGQLVIQRECDDKRLLRRASKVARVP